MSVSPPEKALTWRLSEIKRAEEPFWLATEGGERLRVTVMVSERSWWNPMSTTRTGVQYVNQKVILK